MYSPNVGGVFAASIVILVASATAVALRLYSRHIRHAPTGPDDWTIMAALVLVWAQCVILIFGAAKGTFGTHTEQAPGTGAIITTWHENQSSLLGSLTQMIVVVADGVIKVSLIVMYRRIFLGKIFNIVSLSLLVFMIVWTVAFFFGVVFSCGGKPEYGWLSSMSNRQHCGAVKYVWISHAATDVATDLMVLFVPIPMIWNLKMQLKQKIALLGIFTLGFMSTAAGTARLVYVSQDIYETTTGARDLRAVQTNISVWGMVESGVGVISACLVTFKPLLDSRAVESVINSVRSAISLGSWSSGHRSNGNQRQHSDTANLAGNRRRGAGPTASVHKPETQISSDAHDDIPLSELAQSGIVVQHDITVRRENLHDLEVY